MFLAQGVTIQSIIQAFHDHPESIYTWIGLGIVVLAVAATILVTITYYVLRHKWTAGVIVLMILVAIMITMMNGGKTPQQSELQSSPTISATPTPTPTPKHR